ncbi:MAG: ATP-binding cassette domain-containing protein, partial [Bacteroidaceae bacterium]|nr:ATP-binding cassette domain-containing protein [Bacteroidaceae bacterium]
KHATYKLSGGQKRRIAIAGILAMQPECIVFDEATAMLDPTGRKEIV